MKKGWFVVLVLCVFGMALAACVDYAKAPAAGNLGNDVEVSVECYYNSDCPEGYKCVEGVCNEVPPVGKPDAVVNEPDTNSLVGEDVGEDTTVGQDTVSPGPDTIVGPDTTSFDVASDQPDTEPQKPDTTPVGLDTEPSVDTSPVVEPDTEEPPLDTAPVCEPSTEVCDGKDNDCDGHTDEGLPTFKTTCGTGVCVSTGTLFCKDGELVDSCVPGEAAADDATCDNKDDDCDGETDEDFVEFHSSCGVGACLDSGQVTCENGKEVDSCVSKKPGETELCDNDLDDDCDGAVNEDCPCTKPGNETKECGPDPSQAGVGECKFGTQLCVDGGTWSDCFDEVLPTAEICDGLDNDCDGTTDNGVLNACGQCGEVPPEICDGVDNNCDGQTDEGLLNACDGCGDVPVETCNGVDDDCDGEVDEDLLNPCGVCGPTPEEICDGTDNNCDGETDEGLLNACGSCGDVPVETCNGVDDDCDGETDEGVKNACGECGDVSVETCNGIDDNCNGETDEGMLNACGQCGLVPVEICGNGVDEDCDGSDAECPPSPCQPTTEVCDGTDNDCDGEVDEGLLNACGGCGDVPVETCDGVDNDCNGQTDEGCPPPCIPVAETCNGVDDDCDGTTDNGVLNACGQCGEVPSEVCDGVDNDCDGETDEEFVESATLCGKGVCTSTGTLSCVDGQEVDSCTPNTTESRNEECNSLDDDCDGETDEELDTIGECGVGQCYSVGPKKCISGVWNIWCTPGDSTPEVCDGVDNNCDGETDEGVLNACGQCGEVPAEICGNGVDEDCDGEDLVCPPPPPVCTPTKLHGTYVTVTGVDGCLTAYTCGTYPPVTAGAASAQVSSVEFDFPLNTVCFNVSIDEDCDGDVEFDIVTGEGWACNFWGVGFVNGLLIVEEVSECTDGTTIKKTMTVESQELAGGGNCTVL